MGASVKMKWYGDRVQRGLRAELLSRLESAAELVVERVKQNVAEPSPPVSQAGEFPHRRSGELRDGVGYSVDGRRLTVRVFCRAPHAKFVEAKRPFLRRTFRESRSDIRQIVLNGTGGTRGRFKFQ